MLLPIARSPNVRWEDPSEVLLVFVSPEICVWTCRNRAASSRPIGSELCKLRKGSGRTRKPPLRPVRLALRVVASLGRNATGCGFTWDPLKARNASIRAIRATSKDSHTAAYDCLALAALCSTLRSIPSCQPTGVRRLLQATAGQRADRRRRNAHRDARSPDVMSPVERAVRPDRWRVPQWGQLRAGSASGSLLGSRRDLIFSSRLVSYPLLTLAWLPCPSARLTGNR